MTFPETLTPRLQDLLESTSGEVSTAEVSHIVGDMEYGGFVARPADATTAAPGVLIISDWTGLNDHARVRAVLLARLGYVALAGDVYGGGRLVSEQRAPGEAGRYYGDPALFRTRVAANLDHLRELSGVDPSRVAAIGFCFGGAGVLELARSGAELAGVVSFHGGLGTGAPASAEDIRTPILVQTGAADPVVPDDALIAFENEMRAASAPDWRVISYSGAMHAFMQPDAQAPDHGAQYEPRSAARAWRAMQDFFGEIFA